jgi:arylsulfatase A
MFNQPSQPQPDAAGFEHWFATQNNAAPSHENPTNFVRNGQPVDKLAGYSCQLVADEAIDWLTKHRTAAQARPFFMYVAFHEPHEPVQSPPDLVDRYMSVAKNTDEAQYFANVHNVDSAVGRLLQVLDNLHLSENTLVYFSSDNGPETLNRYPASKRSYGSPGSLRGMKLWTTEAGVRVPGIIRWPAGGQVGLTVDTPVSSLDLLPTLCSMAKAALPSVELDGINLAPLLSGQAVQRDKPLFWFYYNALNEQRAAMRDGKWKVLARFSNELPKFANVNQDNLHLVRDCKLIDFSLFDLENDLLEQNDLRLQQPEILKGLQAKMESLYRDLVESMQVWPSS